MFLKKRGTFFLLVFFCHPKGRPYCESDPSSQRNRSLDWRRDLNPDMAHELPSHKSKPPIVGGFCSSNPDHQTMIWEAPRKNRTGFPLVSLQDPLRLKKDTPSAKKNMFFFWSPPSTPTNTTPPSKPPPPPKQASQNPPPKKCFAFSASLPASRGTPPNWTPSPRETSRGAGAAARPPLVRPQLCRSLRGAPRTGGVFLKTRVFGVRFFRAKRTTKQNSWPRRAPPANFFRLRWVAGS